MKAPNGMTDAAFYLSFVLNGLVATSAFVMARAAIKAKRASEKNAKPVYSTVALLGGLVSGLMFFHGLVWLFRSAGYVASLGHGEVVVAAAVMNLLLSLALLIVGRVLLSWQPLDWQ